MLVLSVHCILVVTCWERAGLLALLYVMFYCVIVIFPCGLFGQVWYLIYRFLIFAYLLTLLLLHELRKQNTQMLKLRKLSSKNYLFCKTKNMNFNSSMHC